MTQPDDTQAIMRKLTPIVESMTDRELSILNKMVIARFKMINKAKAVLALSTMKIGDAVRWHGKDGIIRRGIIIRLNHKTASVKIGEEGYWQVSPELLIKES